MIDNNVKINIFIQFLKDNNIYDEYCRKCKNRTSKFKIILLFIRDAKYLSNNFFKKDCDFWNTINEKWQDQKEDYYKQYKRNGLLNNITTEDNLKINYFIQFMKDNNIYDEYIEAYNTSDIRSLLLIVDGEVYVSGFSSWCDINKSDQFMSEIKVKWIDYKRNYKQYKRNELLNKIL